MKISPKQKLAVGAVAGLALAGAGVAIAASQLDSPKEESQAVVNDAAKQLGVTPTALSNALKKALENRVDAAVSAGRLTKEQGEELKSRIDSGEAPLFGGPGLAHFGHVGFFGGLDAAASYLGLSESELRSELASGKTLAQVAKDHGKSVDGLVQALYDAKKKRLDDAVSAGELTKAQEDSILSGLKQRITEFVNGQLPAPRFGDRQHGWAGPPRFALPGL